ncbi:hypothetical protein FGO68_gene16812 [Halteria grandinella]|uniref:phenylalanine 4-monooxygenase n=1 Tax=Halteria grandinella TaxID=5974 RepID=A0A8J8NPC8_HALGN|nr:hypothetical protein FGO68_gene16812 [Halteria grandinella]
MIRTNARFVNSCFLGLPQQQYGSKLNYHLNKEPAPNQAFEYLKGETSHKQPTFQEQQLFARRFGIPLTLDDLVKVNETAGIEGGELENSENPVILDKEYMRRRSELLEISATQDMGKDYIPLIEYNREEVNVWGSVFKDVVDQCSILGAQEINQQFVSMKKELRIVDSKVVQIRDLSNYLRQQGGWRMRPVSGFLTLKSFLLHLAFKMYPATQYMRHQTGAQYNFEPDILHDVFGHASSLLVPEIAALHHKCGLATLGANDELLEQISAVMWYTFEMGLCRKENSEGFELLGGSLFSSVKERIQALNGSVHVKPLGDLNQLKYSEIQYSGLQKEYRASPPLKELLAIMNEWFDDIIEKQPFEAHFCDLQRRIIITKIKQYW